jgi:Skp family chaperone for outer membrane proteins
MNQVTAMICAATLAGLGVLFTSGCQKGDAADGSGARVGVYDINRVANDLGWMSEMDTNMKNLVTKFKADFDHAHEVYQAQIDKQKTEWAPKDSDKLTQDQLAILNDMKAKAEQVLGQLNQAANQQLADYRNKWIQQYRQALRPALREVSEDKKLWLLLEKTDAVAYNLPSADMSDAIEDAARARPPLITPVPVPVLPSVPQMVVKLPTTEPTTKPAATQPTTAP